MGDMGGTKGGEAGAKLGLRERKKSQTRELIARTAQALFVQRGFDEVTVAEIARAADVAEKTVFNYFPTKEDLVYSGMDTWEEDLLTAIRERPSGQPVLTAFARFVAEPRGLVARQDLDSAQRLAQLTRMVADSPALRAREQQTFAHYTGSLAALIAEETAVDERDPRPWVAANAMMGVHRALIAYTRDRINSGAPPPSTDELGNLSATACGLLAEGFAEYATKNNSDHPESRPQR